MHLSLVISFGLILGMLGERRNIFAFVGMRFKTYAAVIFKVYSTSVCMFCQNRDLGIGSGNMFGSSFDDVGMLGSYQVTVLI